MATSTGILDDVASKSRLPLIAAVGGVALIVLIAVFAPLIAPYSPTEQDFSVALRGPSWAHPFGTDQFGRDVLSRVIFASRIDLLIAATIVGIAMVIGTLVGLTAGYLGGSIGNILMRLVNIALAFPFIILVMAVVSARGPGTFNLVLAASMVWWVSYARLVRAETLVIRELPYMAAARASGYSTPRCIVFHLLPNVASQALIYASSDVIYALLLASSVSFLGLGVQAPTPEWGQMIADSQNFMTTAWWLPLFPGIAIILTGVAFSMLGDAAQNVLSGQEGR